MCGEHAISSKCRCALWKVGFCPVASRRSAITTFSATPSRSTTSQVCLWDGHKGDLLSLRLYCWRCWRGVGLFTVFRTQFLRMKSTPMPAVDVAIQILQFIHPWYENRDFGRVAAASRETSRFGGGPMAQSYNHFRSVRKQNLEYVQRARRRWQNWSRILARAERRTEQRLYMSELRGFTEKQFDTTSTNDSDEDDLSDQADQLYAKCTKQITHFRLIVHHTSMVLRTKPILA